MVMSYGKRKRRTKRKRRRRKSRWIKAPYTPMGDFYFEDKIGSGLYERKKGKMVKVTFDPYFHPPSRR